MIKTIKATKIYNQGRTNEVTALFEASVEVEKGCIAVLKGPSGSGKTTLLSLVGCQSKPNSGEIRIDGKRVSKLPDKFLNAFKRQYMGFVFQNYQLIPDLTVSDNIMLPLLPSGIVFKERIRRADELMDQFDLTKRKKFKVKNLSGGEQQRTAIARALINRGKILLADEPTAHLDSQLTDEFLKIVGRIKDMDYTILMSSHDAKVCENPLVDRVFEMKDGRIIQ